MRIYIILAREFIEQKMKKLLFIFLLISQTGVGQETKYISENYEFQNGELAYLFGNDVKLRDQPSTESNVISLLKIGERIEILEKTNSTMLFEGLESPWYKIKFNDKIGFVLGSLISLDRAMVGNSTFLISLKKEGQQLFLKTRVLEKDAAFKENISELRTEQFSVNASGNKGLENIKNIFKIHYLAESCGIDGGGIYLFYDGHSLIKAMDYSQVADADLYWFIEEYIFPTDEDGMKGKIIYKSDMGENKDYETEWIETKSTKRVLEWNGKNIVPKMDQAVAY